MAGGGEVCHHTDAADGGPDASAAPATQLVRDGRRRHPLDRLRPRFADAGLNTDRQAVVDAMIAANGSPTSVV